MNILKSLLITIIILVIVAIIPILIYDNCNRTALIGLDENGNTTGPYFYLLKIFEEDKNLSDNTTKNISNMVTEWQEFIYARNKMLAPVILYVGIIISILLFVIAGVILKFVKSKVWFISLISSGLFSFLIYFWLYFRIITINTIIQ